jgi:pimeloyl-ACP methyl ester carboxylesterase
MKALSLLLFLLFLNTPGMAQKITGDWYGVLNIQGQPLELVFRISENDKGYTATMDSPQQKAFGIPVTSAAFKNNVLQLKAPAIAGLQYDGVLGNETITGTFKQGGMEIPLNLSREKRGLNLQEVKRNRPQEPKAPFPYVEEGVTFNNVKDSVKLAGTLTLPKKEGTFPAVVLISGSGPQSRDEEILGHKPFLVIADYLTRHGIAVLRYDDRGVAGSSGKFSTATSLDFANDARAAVEYLRNRKDINPDEIGIIGHSEGGIIAPMLAAEDKKISFLVLLAGTGLRGDKVLLKQQELIFRAGGQTEENIKISQEINKAAFDIVNTSSAENLKNELQKFFQERMEKEGTNFSSEAEKEKIISGEVDKFLNPWMYYFLTYDPSEALKNVDVPVLAIIGEKDLQVPPGENLAAIEKALKEGGNDKVTIKEYSGLNHLFQESTTGSPGEYAEIEQTFSPLVLEDIKNWILQIR